MDDEKMRLNLVRHIVSSVVFIIIFSNPSLINPDFITVFRRLVYYFH